ncbi:MAG: DUF4366 domain-containing protein [Clostridia bacterium]|nr:DUF4366 domain-containing protein [Clostridia bacterium]NCC44872.1 DUF4366 domain-containing protein [Clostridia bacterium]
MKKMSKARVSKSLILISTVLALCTPLAQGMNVYAANQPSVIQIEKPEGWKQKGTKISISVDGSSVSDSFQLGKIEAKVGAEGNWEDVTNIKYVTLTKNSTVYVKVTDGEGNVYEQNRSIKCFDDEKPTLAASLTNGVLTIQGNDTISGIASVNVNGTTYTDLNEGQLKIQLTQSDFKTKKITMTATDSAGNTSATYSLQNPYYGWNSNKGNSSDKQESDNSLSTTTDVSTGTTESEQTAPLPQNTTASEPTSATGSVTEKVDTAIESTGETVDTVNQTGTKEGKSFYTITTKSGKTFYLIIDNTKSDNNVYLLTEVSEQDLMNFTMSDTVTLPDSDTVYATVDEEKEETPEETTADKEKETEVVMPEDNKSSVGTYIIIGIVALAVLGGGYYFKVYKPKHEFDDEDEEYEDEYADGFEKEEPEYDQSESDEEEMMEDDDIPEEDE